MAVFASIVTSNLSAHNFALDALQSGCSFHTVDNSVSPPRHKFRVLNCGERAEASLQNPYRFKTGNLYAVGMRYHVTSDFRQNVMQLAHWFPGIPSSFFSPSNGGNWRVGSYIYGTSTNVEFGLQIPDPNAPTSRVQYTSYSLGTKAELVGKTLDIVMHFKASTNTDGFFKVYTSVNGAPYQLKVDRENVRTAWSSMDGVPVPNDFAGYVKVGAYTGDPGNGIAEAVMSAIRIADGNNAVVEVTPGSTPVIPPTPEPTPVEEYRINCGGAALSNFTADEYFTGGEAHNYGSIAIAGTSSPELYQTARNSEFYCDYEFPATSAKTVYLHFSENSRQDNLRSMEIYINGSIVEPELRIYDEAGYRTALVKTYSNVSPINGKITIRISRIGGAPWATINAIRVV